MTTDEIVWSDPPSRHAVPYAPFWKALRERPGQWAEYPGSAIELRKQFVLLDGYSIYVKAKRHPDIEVTTRWIDGERKAWCRFVPEDRERT